MFCKIVDGEIPSKKVYEDENVLAFLDANPVSKGHTLVIPKEHASDIHGTGDMEYMWPALVKVSDALQDAFDPEGMNIAQNNGEAAGQEVFHMHFHITPIYDGNELDIRYNRTELRDGDRVAEAIASEIP